MTLQQLQYFRVLAKIQHYTKASEELLISQPSLSYAIAELEKELNIALFEKQGKKIKLTRYGEFFLSYVEISLDKLDEGIKMLKVLADPSTGKVNLGYIYSLSSSFVPRVIENFYRDKSNEAITFNFIQNLNNVILEDLRNGKTDLAFCVKPSKDTSYIPILKQDLYLIVSKNHPYANRKEISIMEIKDEPFVILNKKSALRQMLDDLFEDIGITPRIVFEAEECNAILSFVALNFGISIIPEVPALKHSDVAVLNIKDCRCVRTIYMAWMEDRYMTPSVKKVKGFISDNYGIIPES